MKIAFLGFAHGHIYGLYQKSLAHKNIQLAGAWEAEEPYRTEALSKGIELTHADYHDLLNDPQIEAVALGLPYADRGRVTIEALNAGKHVIADKPLCTHMEEAEEIERLCRLHNLKVGLMLDLRYMGATVVAKQIIDSGRLGTVHAVNFGGQHNLNYGKRAPWYFEKGRHGGTINDIAVHGIDLISYLTGKNVTHIHAARCWNAFADKVPHFADAAQLIVELEGGIGVTGDVSYATPGRLSFALPQYWRTTIWGTKGVIEFNCTEKYVWAAFEGAETPELIDASKVPEQDYLTDFLADIAGTPTTFDTHRNLATTKTLLAIQRFADQERKESAAI